MVEEKRFRADLFFRINQFLITVPPLRERGEDITSLAYMLLNRYRAQFPEREIRDFHPDALHYLHTHQWPGNIRELANAVQRAVLMTQTPYIRLDVHEEGTTAVATDFEQAIRQFKREFLERAISSAGGNKDLAAQNIGLSRSTFYRYLAQLKK